MKKKINLEVIFTAYIIDISGKALDTAKLGKELLAGLKGYNDVELRIVKENKLWMIYNEI